MDSATTLRFAQNDTHGKAWNPFCDNLRAGEGGDGGRRHHQNGAPMQTSAAAPIQAFPRFAEEGAKPALRLTTLLTF